jgi:signal transduction histidine kinase
VSIAAEACEEKEFGGMCASDEFRAALGAADEPLLLVTTDARIVSWTTSAATLAPFADWERLDGDADKTDADILDFLARCAASADSLSGVVSASLPRAAGSVRIRCLGHGVRFASGKTLVLLRLTEPCGGGLPAGRDPEPQARIRQAERAERARIARDLHDQAGQHALCLKLGLAQLRSQCSGTPVLGAIDELLQQVDAMVADLHRAIVDLRPSALDGQDFTRALDAFSARWSDLSGVPVRFRVEGVPGPLSAHCEAALFRVLQEALTNVAKHATGVRGVDVILRHAEGCATLTIRDDGRGLKRAKRSRSVLIRGAQLGLVGMHERMAHLGGELEMQSAGRGGGTTVVARIHSAECLSAGTVHAV